MSHLTAKDCKVVIECLFTEVKESMIEEVKEGSQEGIRGSVELLKRQETFSCLFVSWCASRGD